MTAVLPYLDVDGVECMELPDWLPEPGADGRWGLQEIAQAANVNYDTVLHWRMRAQKDKEAGRPLRPGSLIEPDQIEHPYGHRTGFPRYDPRRAIRWLQQTGRMDADMRPTRLKHRSGGIRGHRTPPRGEGGRFVKKETDT